MLGPVITHYSKLKNIFLIFIQAYKIYKFQSKKQYIVQWSVDYHHVDYPHYEILEQFFSYRFQFYRSLVCLLCIIKFEVILLPTMAHFN